MVRVTFVEKGSRDGNKRNYIRASINALEIMPFPLWSVRHISLQQRGRELRDRGAEPSAPADATETEGLSVTIATYSNEQNQQRRHRKTSEFLKVNFTTRFLSPDFCPLTLRVSIAPSQSPPKASTDAAGPKAAVSGGNVEDLPTN